MSILIRANQRKLLARNWDGIMERTHVVEEITRMMTGCPRHLRITLASRRGHVKDTSHESDGEDSTLSDVESDDEITPRDDRVRRRAGDAPDADLTTNALEVWVKGQTGDIEVVAPNSYQTRTSGLLEHYLDVG